MPLSPDGLRDLLRFAQPSHRVCHEQRAFAEGSVDVLVARDPLFIPMDDTRITVLYEEPRVLVMPAEHPLAGRESVSPEDFAPGESLVCPPGGAGAIYPTPSHRRSSVRAGLVTVPVEGVPTSKVVVASRAGETNPLVAEFIRVSPPTGARR
ncbi:hypothetical protein JN086_27245 [Mycolicibacterium austroafricanum]|jgi:DNA-binding transcriptional LysR family regulator|uniref:LysR substrate-binding domain-containing protein n=1 Tax=Mycolicibacterium TaxID=1866885 RepID=UPI001AC00388|nr:LysR substrate-binding domain-containing protein [Mycolicibacterium austroafricanum]QRZ06613.1 hypothetical protein JN090_27720 [Mycolicibacterium austroafricanum]QZT68097.1 hypothetical protein JN086_27245 [Mycolicibacterium austroafricanum]